MARVVGAAVPPGYTVECGEQRIEKSVQITLTDDAIIPKYQTDESSGADLYATEECRIEPGCSGLISTGLCVAVPIGYELQIRPRSSLALRNMITVLNSPGTVDSDYRGEIGVILMNHGKLAFKVNRGDRIAQMVLCPVVRANFVIVEELDTTVRAAGGFGSTGV